MNTAVTGGLDHLLSLQDRESGAFPMFGDTVRHGDSIDWTTACMASSIYEVTKNPNHPSVTKARDLLIRLQRNDGGWAYNEKVPSDPDSAARVLQFLQKIGYQDALLFQRGYHFILTHQDPISGGIRTYTPERLQAMGYPGGGWDQPHMCVSALVYNILPESDKKDKLGLFLLRNIQNEYIQPYWWTLKSYVQWELSRIFGISVGTMTNDVVDKSLHLMGNRAKGNSRWGTMMLHGIQLSDGSFPASNIFHIPPSNHPVGENPKELRIIGDTRRAFSTAAATVALARAI